MKVLFCTDGSEICLSALDNVANFLKDPVIDSLCVIDWSFLPDTMNIDQENYSQAYENIADSVLIYSKKAVEERGMQNGEQIKLVGSAVEGILEQIENKDYDLVVMGSHGKKGLQKWLGSVSRQVASHSKIPIFISKRKTANKKVLFTTDGSEHSYTAVKQAMSLFDFSDKELFIISVKENPEMLPLEAAFDRNWLDNIEKQLKIHATKAINKVKNLLESGGYIIHNEVILTGNPAQMIIDFARKEEIDLVVMGARSKPDLSILLLGSVSKRVLENVSSCVSVIRKKHNHE